MINVTVFQNAQEECIGFKMAGHAEYADYGKDIVCAAVSVLVINTINSIEMLATDTFTDDVQSKEGAVSFRITSNPVSKEATLLLRSMLIGLDGIQKEYGSKCLKIKVQEM